MKAFAPIILAVCGLLTGTLSARMLSESELRSSAENLVASPETAQMLGGARTLRSLETIAFPNGDLRVAHLSPSGHVLFTPSGEQVRISEYDFVFPEADSPGYLLLNSVAEAGIDRSEGPAVTASLLSTATYEYVEPIRLTAWNQRGTLEWLSPRDAPGGCTAIAYAQIMRALEWPVWLDGPVSEKLKYSLEYVGASLFTETYTVYPYRKIDYSRITKAPYYATDKGYETLENTKLVMLVDIFSGMQFSPGASGAFIHDATTNPWYEPYIYLHNWNGDNFDSFLNYFYQAAQEEIPICAEVYSTQGNHAIMITGWQGSTLEAAQAYFNFGWGESAYQRDDGWYSLRLLKSTSAYNYIIHAYLSRPKKTVQVAPLRKVTTPQPTLEWALAKCYADDVSGFTVKMTSDGTATTHQVAADARTWTSPVALTEGRSYSFTVTPVFTDSAVTPIESNTVSTTIRADADMAPREVTFASGSSVSHPDMSFKDGAFRSVTFNGTSVIHVTAPPSTVELTVHSMRPESFPASAIAVHKVGDGKYDLVVDGTKPTDRYDNTRVLYTVCAKDAYGTITAGEMILHYSNNSLFPSEPYAGTPTPEPEPEETVVTLRNGHKLRVPHSWVRTHFPDCTDFDGQLEGDSDKDGFSDAEEYFIGTDPKDGTHHLKIEAVGFEDGKPRFTVTPETPGDSAKFTIYGSATLNGTWKAHTDADTAHRFFRVRAEMKE